ncbi:MAG: hypothetical protein QM673_16000, partial [Gordonia sp. (in: high G+C Gram-positive bacteria)]
MTDSGVITQQAIFKAAADAAGGLAGTVGAAMLTGRGDLSVFDVQTQEWHSARWSEVYVRAIEIARQLQLDAAA